VFGHRGSKVKEYGNFVELVLNKYKNNENVKVVSDIFTTVSSTDLIVYVVNHLIINNIRGVYHVVGSDNCSWYEFASEIFNLNGFDKNRLSSIQSVDKKQLINRGNNTSLSNKKLLKTGIQIPNWKSLLENYFKYEKI
jgi:dTDP-4-dehydrorhamnose reductase